MRGVLLTALAVVPAACLGVSRAVEPLAEARIVSDFDTYTLRRIGLVPFTGDGLSKDRSQELQAAFFAEISAATPFEVVPLALGDLAEIPRSEPYRRGSYEARTIIGLSRRFNLDAILIGTITDQQYFPPQRLGIQVDMVAAETGLVIWSSSLQLDASKRRVRDSLRAWSQLDQGDLQGEDWELALISPRRFGRFAAWQVARLL
jgi:hypothetical protein